MIGDGEYFVLRAKGDSMTGAGIFGVVVSEDELSEMITALSSNTEYTPS